MTLELALDIQDAAWGDPQALCERAVRIVLESCGEQLPPGRVVEISLVLADDATVQDLNRTWRDKDAPTNVLSFPGLDDDDPELPDDAPLLLGDVILAYETCAAEAERDGITIQDHLVHLVVHGMLHLLGYDHEAPDDAQEMEGLEVELLALLNIANPYKDDHHE